MPTDVLILTAPFGSGHTAAAQATAAGLQALAPGLHVQVVDAAQHSKTLSWAAKSYLSLLRWGPAVYRQMYGLTAARGGRVTTSTLLTGMLLRPMQRVLRAHNPRLVVCTHPFPAAVAARLRRRGDLAVPVCTVVTDFHGHPLWVQPGLDRYCVPGSFTAADLCAAGAAPHQMVVTGAPIRRGFAPAPPPEDSRVLVLGGALGLGPLAEVARALGAQGLPVTVVCGTNQALRQELQALRLPNLTVLGFTSEIARLMRESRVLVTKPGGLSCSEALATGLPLVLVGQLPGHEEANAAALAAQGVALRAESPAQVVAHVQRLLQDPTAHRRAREACLALGRPDSAAAVAAELLGLLSEAEVSAALA